MQVVIKAGLTVHVSGDAEPCGGLEEFTESLSKFTRFSSFRPLATLSYASDIYNSSSIVSR
jgi:E3 ubiquitin-protein ligase RFWD2